MRILAFAAVILGLVSLSLSGCEAVNGSQEVSVSKGHGSAGEGSSEHGSESHGEEGNHEHKIVLTSPLRKDVISTQPYVCQIHSCQHIEVRALNGGYLEKIGVKEGQHVKKGEVLFKIRPILFEARLNAEQAEVDRLQIELDNAEVLLKKSYLASAQVALKKAELAKAKANLELAKAELGFTDVVAPFDGIVDRQHAQLGSLIEEGDLLTTMSDNSLMWVYFNVPEKNYLAYKADLDKDKAEADKAEAQAAAQKNKDGEAADSAHAEQADEHVHLEIELKLANHEIFPYKGKIGAIEADFNNVTGNIAFRADFPNPNNLLRNGQTGTILIHRVLKDVLVIPQRAKFDQLARPYVYVVDDKNVVHQRDITVRSTQDDIFVIGDGLKEGDKIILEGLRQVRDGDKIEESEFRDPQEVLKNLKYHAE
jgi:membrane fusion protein (multidrug efflux system)